MRLWETYFKMWKRISDGLTEKQSLLRRKTETERERQETFSSMIRQSLARGPVEQSKLLRSRHEYLLESGI